MMIHVNRTFQTLKKDSRLLQSLCRSCENVKILARWSNSSCLTLRPTYRVDGNCQNVSYSKSRRSFYVQSLEIFAKSEQCFHSSSRTLAQGEQYFHSWSRTLALEVENLQVDERAKCVNVTVAQKVLKMPFVWLRDHCRSDVYYNWSTNQKNADPDLLQKNLVPDAVSVSPDHKGLELTWKDGHKTEYSADWLQKNFYPGRFSRGVQRCLWDSASIQGQMPRVSFDEHMNSEEGLKKTVSNLFTYGFSLVDGAPASMDGVQTVVERLTFVLRTLFGEMWSFTADGSRSDTAYSKDGLGAHTDQTFMNHPAGMQIFQCLKHDGAGGETLLVDGFRAIDELRETDHGAFELLSKTVIPHEYVEPPGDNTPGYHLLSLGTVVQVHPSSGETMQLRFNPYDRAPLNTVAPEQIEEFYKAYDQLSRIIAKQEGELWIKLKPGMVLLIDNWRVMHGRAAFDGERVMSGCYLPRDEWISKARVLGLI